MDRKTCKYCGKDITGHPISCWPLSGSCCYDCYYTAHRKSLKRHYEEKGRTEIKTV